MSECRMPLGFAGMRFITRRQRSPGPTPKNAASRCRRRSEYRRWPSHTAVPLSRLVTRPSTTLASAPDTALPPAPLAAAALTLALTLALAVAEPLGQGGMAVPGTRDVDSAGDGAIGAHQQHPPLPYTHPG